MGCVAFRVACSVDLSASRPESRDGIQQACRTRAIAKRLHKPSLPPARSRYLTVHHGGRMSSEPPHSSGTASGSSRSSTAVDSVEVINGAARRTQVFEEEQPPVTPQGPGAHKKAGKHLLQRGPESTSAIPDVEVINGAHWETRRFEGAEDEIAAPWIGRRNIPRVVVGVASVESANRRGNTSTIASTSTAPIVIGISSSESKGHGENAKPVAYRIAPGQPKRPPYHPDPPGF